MRNSIIPTAPRRDSTPLESLLIAGGDARLALEGGINLYGCAPTPRPTTRAFSSSTASTISTRAYRRVEDAYRDFPDGSDVAAFCDSAMNRLRDDLLACLKLDASGADIVFSPSGTDSQLHALFFAKLALGNPITTIVVGADQTGSGTAYTSRGLNFADRTAKGTPVEMGTTIPGLADGTNGIDIPLFAAGGGRRADHDVDASIFEEITIQIAKGRHVVLHIMDASKLGWRAPSDRCLRDISERWPASVLVVVDACQMRLSRARIRAYLERGYLVLMTGSKFFGGPPFSGATLVPAKLARRIETMDIVPNGLAHYAARADIPMRWPRLRAQIRGTPNIGQWLRWEAALEEIRTYYALPPDYRRKTMIHLSNAIRDLINGTPTLELISSQPDMNDGIDDEEMATRNVFAFLLRKGDGYLRYEDTVRLYRALNTDLTATLSNNASVHERELAASLCHIGQPVRLTHQGHPAAVLRINIGARHFSDAWSDDAQICRHNIEAVIDDAARCIAKLAWLVDSQYCTKDH